MEEKTILTELGVAIDTLKTLALVTLNTEDTHPLALPEPPAPDKVAAYERHMNAICQQLAPRLWPLPATSSLSYCWAPSPFFHASHQTPRACSGSIRSIWKQLP